MKTKQIEYVTCPQCGMNAPKKQADAHGVCMSCRAQKTMLASIGVKDETKTKWTPGPWKVMPCPVHAGKHLLQDCRWIATADAEVELSPHVPNDWRLESGSLICEMRDTLHQPYDAHLIAAAPQLAEACKFFVDGELPGDMNWKCVQCKQRGGLHLENCWIGKARELARAALALVEGGT